MIGSENVRGMRQWRTRYGTEEVILVNIQRDACAWVILYPTFGLKKKIYVSNAVYIINENKLSCVSKYFIS